MNASIMGTLRGADGDPFDIAYMNSQVDAHQKVLETINRELLPAASDEKLRDSLEDMQDTVESHLKEARAIQAELTKK
jgi:putative membrane protein